EYVEGEEAFLANYADVLTDLPLDRMVDKFLTNDAAATLLAVPPQSAFHCVEFGEPDRVSNISSIRAMPLWENGGYFVLRPEIFDHLPENGDLVEDACCSLAKQGKLMAYPYRGFWHPADTIKDRNALEAAYQSGNRPWMLWEQRPDRYPFQGLVAQGLVDQGLVNQGLDR
ncbi:MAG: glucose-1-phosphate cytidylyltransferase, partial [Pseudonocardiaceae bacterium]